MRSAYQSFRTAAFDVTVVRPRGNQELNVMLNVRYAAPNKVRAVVAINGMKEYDLYCDGVTITTIDASTESRESQPFALDMLTQALPGNLETVCFFDWQKQLSTTEGNNMHGSKLSITAGETWDGRKWTILEEKVDERKIVVKYYIDAKTKLIWRSVTRSSVTESIMEDAQMTRLVLGQVIDPKTFSAPPPSWELKTLRNE